MEDLLTCHSTAVTELTLTMAFRVSTRCYKLNHKIVGLEKVVPYFTVNFNSGIAALLETCSEDWCVDAGSFGRGSLLYSDDKASPGDG